MLSRRRVMNSSISTWVLTHFISGTGSSGRLFTLGWYGHTCPFLNAPHLPHLYDPRPLSSSAVAEDRYDERDGGMPPPGVWLPGRGGPPPWAGAVWAVDEVPAVREEAAEREGGIPGWCGGWCGGGGPPWGPGWWGGYPVGGADDMGGGPGGPPWCRGGAWWGSGGGMPDGGPP